MGGQNNVKIQSRYRGILEKWNDGMMRYLCTFACFPIFQYSNIPSFPNHAGNTHSMINFHPCWWFTDGD